MPSATNEQRDDGLSPTRNRLKALHFGNYLPRKYGGHRLGHRLVKDASTTQKPRKQACSGQALKITCESLNYQLRKIIKNRGHFPNDDAVIKLLWLAIRDIEDKRTRQRAKEAGKPRDERKAPGKLVEGGQVQGWKAALNALAMTYPDRLAGHIN